MKHVLDLDAVHLLSSIQMLNNNSFPLPQILAYCTDCRDPEPNLYVYKIAVVKAAFTEGVVAANKYYIHMTIYWKSYCELL